jgi:FtsP/CotA-like multicopper oxidase with cupredoxin domain
MLSSFLAGGESANPPAAAAKGKLLPTVEQQAAGMVSGAALVEPPDLDTATAGDLTVQLTAAQKEVMISGKKVLAETYNGSLVGPTLHAVPGRRVTLNLKNELGTATNLHFHGIIGRCVRFSCSMPSLDGGIKHQVGPRGRGARTGTPDAACRP